MNREPADDFEEIAEWLRSEKPPFSDSDRAAMRRTVWREIEARRQLEGAFRPGRLLLAGAAALAAVSVAVLWLRPSAPAAPAYAAVTATPATVAKADPSSLVEELVGPPAIGPVRPYVQRRRKEPASVPVRIEFQTANPEVRIIWLVKKGEAAPRPSSPGRHQEVS